MPIPKRIAVLTPESRAYMAGLIDGEDTLTLPGQSALCRLACEGSHMATNLSIDPELLERALEVSGERTKKAAVTRALEEFIQRRRQKRLLDLMGQLEWDESFGYKAERSRS